MTSKEKREERLVWALRYVMTHPDLSPKVMSEVLGISVDECLRFCTCTLVQSYFGCGIKNSTDFQRYEEIIFKKLTKLK